MLTALKSCTPTTLKNHYMSFKHWNFVRFVAFVYILVNFESKRKIHKNHQPRLKELGKR